jgi:elongation factor P
MVVAGDFRNGVTFELDGQVFQIVEFQHVKPGKGSAFVRVKMKNVISGATVERTFNPSDKMPKAHIERKDMQYLYNDGDLYYFMDVVSFEQLPINSSSIGDQLKFVKENDVCKILSFKGNVFGIEAQTFVELKITQTEPGFKGDTAQGATKPATVETGAIVKVPLFVNEGEVIRIDTRTGEYMERV